MDGQQQKWWKRKREGEEKNREDELEEELLLKLRKQSLPGSWGNETKIFSKKTWGRKERFGAETERESGMRPTRVESKKWRPPCFRHQLLCLLGNAFGLCGKKKYRGELLIFEILFISNL
jgi:hypothetical protein